MRLEVFAAPPRDPYQFILEQQIGHIIAEKTGLGFEHTDGGVVLQISQQGRSGEPTRAAYAKPARWLEAYCGVAPTDLIGSGVANGWQDWSFCLGRTQLLRGDL